MKQRLSDGYIVCRLFHTVSLSDTVLLMIWSSLQRCPLHAKKWLEQVGKDGFEYFNIDSSVLYNDSVSQGAV